MSLLTIFICLVFIHSLFAARLEQTILTTPIVFTTAGLIVGIAYPTLLESHFNQELFLHLAEAGLVLLLFTDASRTDLKMLNRIRNLPVRLLSTGMLLTILLGSLCALGLFPKLSIWEAGILSAILAPTDAGLGQIIVNSPRVPTKIRQALNVEAGLNDGLSVPFLLFFIALGSTTVESPHARLTLFIVEQLGYGMLVGLSIGLLGGWLLASADKLKWTASSWQHFGVVALPLLCALASEKVGASMFIAAFVAGLAVQVFFKKAGKHCVEFTEEWGQLLNLSVFFLFGMIVASSRAQFTLLHFLYALLSLTLVRMLPVAIALAGTGLRPVTTVFVGWFGPRGLASIVLGLVYLEQETHQPGEATIRCAVMITVLVSIFAHGLSAIPGMCWYESKLSPKDVAEMELDANKAPVLLQPEHH